MTFHGRFRSGAIVASLLLLGGCCDKQAVEKCRIEAQARAKLFEKPAITSQGLMRFDIRSSADVSIDAAVIKASCVSSKNGAAEVKIDWKVATPGVRGVRVSVGTGNTADKVWIESGPESSGVTGPWIQHGSRIELHDSFGGGLLGEIRVVGLPCGGA